MMDGLVRLVWLACIHMAGMVRKKTKKKILGATRDIIEYSWISMCWKKIREIQIDREV
jgi:hypothetical protein